MSLSLLETDAQQIDNDSSQEDESSWGEGVNWQHAVGVLLRAAGCLGDVSQARSLADVASLLEGSGVRLEKAVLINQTISSAASRIGALVELQDGRWQAFLGNKEDIILLSEKGEALETFSALPLSAARSAWILDEHVASLKSVSTFLRRYKGHFADLFLSAIVVNIFALSLPLFSSFVYDKILGNGIVETLWALVMGLGLIVGVEFCVRMMRIHVAEKFAVTSEVEIDHATFHNLMSSRANEMPSLGSMLEKYKQILLFRDFLSSSYILALADLPFLALFLFAIAVAAGPLVLVPLVCGGLMLLTNICTTEPILDYDRKSRNASEHRFGLMADVMTSREAVIGSALKNKLAERWRQASVSSVQTASKARYWRGLNGSITSTISYLSFVGTIVGGVYMVEDRSLTSGGLLAASLLTSRTMGSFASVNMLLLRYREFRTALRELNQLAPPPSKDVSKSRHGRLQGAVRFDKVTCRLRKNSTPVLDRVSLVLNPGEFVAIAGPPGAGKTTLLRLLAGLLVPDEGRILIDNIPLENLSEEDLSFNMGFKPQDCCLLDGTIEDNIRAGRPPMPPEIRQDVLSTSGLGRIFSEGSLNWMTNVGPRGSHLSGGQRQMVALARALLTRPPIVMLDEPTNGLDASMESHFANQLVQMRGRSTILVSTHSRSLLSLCDRIIVVGQSKILADGPRDKILSCS